jgi:dTDP-4-dehydrorhamnose 3,5-epimerase-like enzyme
MTFKALYNSIFKNKRGLYWTSWIKEKYAKLNFNQDKFFILNKYVSRCLYVEKKIWKLVSCIFEKVFFLVVNYNKKNKNYLKFKTYNSGHKNRLQILITSNFLNVFFVSNNSRSSKRKLNLLKQVL